MHPKASVNQGTLDQDDKWYQKCINLIERVKLTLDLKMVQD